MDAFAVELETLREVLPHEDHKVLEALLWQGLTSNEIVELVMLQPEVLKDGIFHDMDIFDMRPTSAEDAVPLNGRPEKHDLVFETLALDEDVLYNAAWKSEHGAQSTAEKGGAGGVIQSAPAPDDTEEEGAEEAEVAFLKHFHDSWVVPVGDRAAHLMGGRYFKGAPSEVPEEDDPAPETPAPQPLNEEVMLWGQEWEEESDEDELLTAHDRLQVYSDVFSNGRFMEVGRELRENPKVFAKEKKEVLARLIRASKEHLEHKPNEKSGGTEPVSPASAKSDSGVDRSVITVADPCRDVWSICCCSVFVAIDNQVRVAELDALDARNDWRLPGKHPDGMVVDLRNVNLSFTPIKWRWRLQSCLCCGIGPCVCRDQGTTGLGLGGDASADFEISLHPAPTSDRAPITFRKADLDLAYLRVNTSETKGCCGCATPSESLRWEHGSSTCGFCREKCCDSWFCGLPACCYSCVPVCCGPCIRSYIESQYAGLPTHFPKPPPAQKMV